MITPPNRATLVAGAVLLLSAGPDAQTGHVLNGVGPVNQSMAGAGTGLPLEALGALHWNPASITALERSQVALSLGVLSSTVEVSSTLDAGALAPGTPAVDQAGSTTSDGGLSPIPAMGVVFRAEGSPWAYGVEASAIAGFGVDYPTDPSNPILAQPTLVGFGVGDVRSRYTLIQITPTVARRVTERLSVGFGLSLNRAYLEADPFAGAAPDDDDGDTFMTYPDGSSGDDALGIGLRAGLFWTDGETWQWGAAIKSTQWFEEFSINSETEDGTFQELEADLDYPMIASVGVGYLGFERTRLAFDLRYIDYAHTDGFDDSGYAASGAAKGLGWKSILVAAAGVEYDVNDSLKLRGGYSYNENPISDSKSFFNIASTGIIQHHLACGMSLRLGERASLALGYIHGFENSTKGPWQLFGVGPVAGSTVENTLSSNLFTIGLNVDF